MSSRRGRRSRCRSRPRSTAPRASSRSLNRRRGFDDDLEPALRANNVDRGDARRDERRGRRVAARLPALPPRQGAAARSRRRPPVVGSLRTRRRRERASRGPTRPSACSAAFGGYSPDLLALADARVRRAVGRRRDPRRQARRRLLLRRRRRRQPRDDELRRQPRLGVDARARARPRVPQRRARRPHAAAAPAPDGARGNRVDLLRDAAVRAVAATGDRRRRTARAARHAPRRRVAGRRRHPQPLPLRDRAVREAAAHEPVGQPS